MIIIDNQEHYDNVIAFAVRTNQAKNLQEQFDYLDTYAEHGDRGLTRCHLGYDFAPYSFSFYMEKRREDGSYKHWYNGGLIYHGEHDNGGDGGSPTFSVNLNPNNGWSIHT